MLSALRRGTRLTFHVAAGAATGLVFIAFVLPIERVRGRVKRRRGSKPAVLWGPVPIPNIRYSALADRLYGYRSETLVYDVYHISARDDFDHVLDRWTRVPGLRTLVPYGAFLWAVSRFDIFCFFFDGGLLQATPFWRAELAFLRLAGKRIVVYPYGGDARLPSRARAADPWNAYTDVPVGAEDRQEGVVEEHLNAFGRYADVILGCNDIVEDLPRVDAVFRYPFDLRGWVPVEEREDGTVTVVHAANHRHYKGTRFVVEAVERLQAEGLAVELVLVEGMSNVEARSIYERADIIASDFLIGGYALFAIEGMALGKPVLCYLPDRLARFHPEWSEAPIVDASPDTLTDRLRELVIDPEQRLTLGRAGPAYVRKYHSLESVGRDMDAVYRGLWR